MPELIDVNGLKVSAERPSQVVGPPLVLVHGLLGGAWYFEKYQRFFAERGHASYAVNLRGHHGSRPVHDVARVSIMDYVDDVLEVTRTLEDPVLLGHSMGGLIAQKVGERDGLRGLVLLCAVPPRGIVLAGATLFRKQLKHLPSLVFSRPLQGSLDDAVDLFFNLIPADEREALHANVVSGSARAARECSLGAIAVDERRIRCPVLVVGGTQDRFVPVYVARRLAAKYSAQYLEFADHAHFIVWEPGWERPASAIAEWLAKLPVAA